MKVITTNNQKGGEGKTFGAVTLAKFLSFYGRTLLVDADGSGNATLQMTTKVNEDGHPISIATEESKLERVFRGEKVIPLTVDENLDMLTSDRGLNQVRKEQSTLRYTDETFRKWTKRNKLKNVYDYIVIDTHNDLEDITTNMLLTSDIVLGITTPSKYGTTGLMELINHVNQLKENSNLVDDEGDPIMTAEIYFVGNMVEYNTEVSRQFVKDIMASDMCLGYFHHRNIINEATLNNTTIFDETFLDKKKYKTESFKDFFKEVADLLVKIKKTLDQS